MRYLGGAMSLEQALGRVDAKLTHWRTYGFGLWVCELRADGRFVGVAGLAHLAETGEVDVAYMLYPSSRRQGLATEAAAEALACGFGDVGLDRIVALTQEENRASQRVLERLGMRHERDLEAWGTLQRYYALERADWIRAHSTEPAS